MKSSLPALSWLLLISLAVMEVVQLRQTSVLKSELMELRKMLPTGYRYTAFDREGKHIGSNDGTNWSEIQPLAPPPATTHWYNRATGKIETISTRPPLSSYWKEGAGADTPAGTPCLAVTHRYNPKTGKIEPVDPKDPLAIRDLIPKPTKP